MKKFPTIINAILAKTKESRASLCKRAGISKTSMNDFLAGRKDLSFDAVIALVAAFPAYNARWLLTGVKSQAMIDHQKKLDAAKKPLVSAESIAVMKAVEAEPVAPSDGVVRGRLRAFCKEAGLDLAVNCRNGKNYAECENGDIFYDDRILHTSIKCVGERDGYLSLAKTISGKLMKTYDGFLSKAPNFFDPI